MLLHLTFMVKPAINIEGEGTVFRALRISKNYLVWNDKISRMFPQAWYNNWVSGKTNSLLIYS